MPGSRLFAWIAVALCLGALSMDKDAPAPGIVALQPETAREFDEGAIDDSMRPSLQRLAGIRRVVIETPIVTRLREQATSDRDTWRAWTHPARLADAGGLSSPSNTDVE